MKCIIENTYTPISSFHSLRFTHALICSITSKFDLQRNMFGAEDFIVYYLSSFVYFYNLSSILHYHYVLLPSVVAVMGAIDLSIIKHVLNQVQKHYIFVRYCVSKFVGTFLFYASTYIVNLCTATDHFDRPINAS